MFSVEQLVCNVLFDNVKSIIDRVDFSRHEPYDEHWTVFLRRQINQSFPYHDKMRFCSFVLQLSQIIDDAERDDCLPHILAYKREEILMVWDDFAFLIMWAYGISGLFPHDPGRYEARIKDLIDRTLDVSDLFESQSQATVFTEEVK